jgi:hypothetical protein
MSSPQPFSFCPTPRVHTYNQGCHNSDEIKTPESRSSSSPCTFRSSSLLVPFITTYNVNSLSYYSADRDAGNRKFLISSFLHDAIKTNDIICLQETNLAPAEAHALSSLPGCRIIYNNLHLNQAGTAIIETPSLLRHYTSERKALPTIATGFVQLQVYSPRNPAHQRFQLFNVYFKSGHDFSFLSELIVAMKAADPNIPTFVCGDFNFIEYSCDTTSAHPILPPSNFLALWNDFKTRYSLVEGSQDRHTLPPNLRPLFTLFLVLAARSFFHPRINLRPPSC